MCGISGFIDGTLDEDRRREAIGRMITSLRHRGPDDEGFWMDSEVGAVLGQTRLAVLDLSPTGHQPMVSSCGRYVLVYNGELYNFRDLRKELEAVGEQFRGSSDTEVFLVAIRAWGVTRALERADGMFALALWDRRERVLHLARDPMGEKPLYYMAVGNRFVFGSELKALTRHPAFEPTIDRDALALFMRFGYVPAPFTIFDGVKKLSPGTSLQVDIEDGIEVGSPVSYWSLRKVAESGLASQISGSLEDVEEELDSLLRRVIRSRMVSDVPIGAFLSGGVDSSTVVSIMQSVGDAPVQTFTIGFEESQFNEADHARRVADYLGAEHTELYVSPREARDVIPRLPHLYDEPFADASQIPTFIVSELASRRVTVALSGDGGDELFAGYTRHLWFNRVRRVLEAVPMPARRTLGRVLSSLQPRQVDALFGRLRPLLPRALQQRSPGQKVQKLARALAASQVEDLYLRLVSKSQNPEELVLGAVEPTTDATDPSKWLEAGSPVERIMYLDAVSYLPDDLLVKTDRASMAVGLEVRVPLLSKEVVEFAWRIPEALRMRDGQGKWILRQVLSRYVPPELTNRPKAGFTVPVRDWLRGPLRDWSESLLREDRLQREGYLDSSSVRRLWHQHLSGRQDHQELLWSVLMFESWLQELQGQSHLRQRALRADPIAVK